MVNENKIIKKCLRSCDAVSNIFEKIESIVNAVFSFAKRVKPEAHRFALVRMTSTIDSVLIVKYFKYFMRFFIRKGDCSRKRA